MKVVFKSYILINLDGDRDERIKDDFSLADLDAINECVNIKYKDK